jgi:hypothetical protein
MFSRCRRRFALAALRRPQENVEGHPNLGALCFSIPTMMVVMVMVMTMMVVVVVVVTVPPWPDPDGNAGTMMVVMMVMTDHNLSGLNGVGLGQPGIVGF